jgi:hypothetical protein
MPSGNTLPASQASVSSSSVTASVSTTTERTREQRAVGSDVARHALKVTAESASAGTGARPTGHADRLRLGHAGLSGSASGV